MYAAFVFNSLALDPLYGTLYKKEVKLQSDLSLEFKRPADRLKKTFSTDYLCFSFKYQMESLEAC